MENLYNKVKEEIYDEAGITKEDRKTFCEGMLKHGCVSGAVADMLFKKFVINTLYDNFKEEIENLVSEYAEAEQKNRLEFLGSLNGADDVTDIITEKNLLCWFAFEEMVSKVYEEEVKNEK